MLSYIKALARKFISDGFTLHESVRLAGEDIAPYSDTLCQLGIQPPRLLPSRRFRLNSSL